MAHAVALTDGDMAGQDDIHPRPGLAGLEQLFAVLENRGFRQTAVSARSPAAVSVGKVWSWRGKKAACAAAGAAVVVVVVPSLIPISLVAHRCHRYWPGLLGAVVIWRGVLDIGRRRHIGRRLAIAAPARLRFPALEIFAQRLFQPVLPLILSPISFCAFARIFRKGTALLAFAVIILHREPVLAVFEIVGGVFGVTLTKFFKIREDRPMSEVPAEINALAAQLAKDAAGRSRRNDRIEGNRRQGAQAPARTRRNRIRLVEKPPGTGAVFDAFRPSPRLRERGPCGKDRPAL